MVQVVLDQSAEVAARRARRADRRTHHGFVCANAGVDASNAGATGRRSCCCRATPTPRRARIRARLRELAGGRAPAVLITDSFGRAWRHGQVDVAIGLRRHAPAGRLARAHRRRRACSCEATWLAVADAAAATADLARAKDSREPVVLVERPRALRHRPRTAPARAALLRPLDEDLFR